jgi:hypothetical protein
MIRIITLAAMFTSALAALALMLALTPSANATLDGCAVVLKTPDGFLNETLEAEIDRHHAALHTVDELSGRTRPKASFRGRRPERDYSHRRSVHTPLPSLA